MPEDGVSTAHTSMNGTSGQATLTNDLPSALLNDVPRNRLLAALPREALAQILPALTHVPLPSGMVIYEPRVRITHVYFVLTGIISMVCEMREGTVEVGSLGSDASFKVSSRPNSNLCHACALANLLIPQYYTDIATVKEDTRGVAPFLMAAVEWEIRNNIES